MGGGPPHFGTMELEHPLATLPRVRGDRDDDGKERRSGTPALTATHPLRFF